ncbi:MAG: hypothetical protein Phyf2KO_19710 [Phycisphaerales bacterium]
MSSESDHNPIFEAASSQADQPEPMDMNLGDIEAIADVEARCRALIRAEQQLAEREQAFNEMSANMAHDLRETAEALRDREQALESAGGVPVFLLNRRERLARMRLAVRDRVQKLERTEAVLNERAREADQVLANRREIAKQASVLQKREERVRALMSRNKTVSTVFYTIATLAIVAVLSWAVADQVAPARYAVTAEIVADGRGRILSEDELAVWQKYHGELLTDPSLVELASDRLGKRGIEELSRPGDLASRIKTDLTTQSHEDGKLVLELRGEGAGLTTRTLDTLVVSIVSLANGTKDQRAGGAGSKVAVDAKVVGEPLVDERPMYAGAIGGGGVLIIGVGGLGMYRRLRAQHAAYEQGLIGG